MKRILKIVELLFLSSLLFVLLSFTIKNENTAKKNLNLIQINHTQNSFVDEKKVLEILSNKGLYYDNQEVFDVESMEYNIKNQPHIKDVQVFLNLDGAIDVIIEERDPLVRILKSEASYYLDEDCLLMPLSETYTSRKLIASGDVEKYNMEDICELSKIIESNEFMRPLISQIHFENNDVLLIPKIKNQKINIGDIEDLEIKFDNLICFYDKIIKYKGWDYYNIINLKYKDQIICSKK
jgi:cell division protein FtsQ